LRCDDDWNPPASSTLWPYRHGKWWNWDARANKTEDTAALMAKMRLGNQDEARESLTFAETIAQTARDRADAADRRATTIASSVAIAASFTLSGGGLLFDVANWGGNLTLRRCFAVGLFFTTLCFVLAGIYALRALASKQTRTWNWINPHNMWASARKETHEQRLGLRAVRLLQDFAANWEIADLKNRTVDNALRCLVWALLGITVLAGISAMSVF
jgi:hypothetical protein